jgi:vacuolar protein sorting-associated protein 51
MQMLVYENYNKFISATETIKRMKNNVDAMDGDMEAVRSVQPNLFAGLDDNIF